MGRSAPAPLHWTTYVRNREALEAGPSEADNPDNARAFRNVLIATLIAAVGVGACVSVARGLETGSLAFALNLLGAIGVFLWVFLVLPQLLAHRLARRWDRAYSRLCADPHRARATIQSLELRWNRNHSQCTVMGGRASYTADDGVTREIEMLTGLGKSQANFYVQLPRHEVPSNSSGIVVWHTADHSIVHCVVHADGSGAAGS